MTAIYEHAGLTSQGISNCADYVALHDATLPHLPWELYQRWKSYGDGNAIVSSNGDKTNYCQLVWQVESKYAALGKNNLQAGEVVALGGAMGVEMVATLVACWLRGLTVVLVDGNQPEKRRQRLLEIAAPSLIVDHDGEVGRGVLNVRHCIYQCLTSPPEPIPNALTVDGAYIVFTSGSTGEPKAILGSHQGLAHFICWQSQEFDITPHDRFAQLTAVGFDVIYRSVLTPLFSGAQLWIPPHDVSEGEAMLEWLGRHGINALHLVPCIMKTWLASCQQTALPDLRCIFSAGEMLHGKVVQAICRQWSFTGQLVNLYGPSETTLAKCFYRCQAGDGERGSIPVGLPPPNTEIWIMDGSRRCAPVEPGEVVIRTPYRALGYVNSTGTASWPTANAQKSEDYLYYTGDLGHLDEQGLLYLHGRIDDQIKINGVRIEPGEIEAFLQRQPQVEEAVVCLDDGSGLVAHLAAPDSLSVDDINEALSQAFPVVMRPRVMIHCRLSQNANGKVDRGALKALPRKSAMTRFAVPVGETETIMAEIWQKHLSVEAVGRPDDFFSLGGNSISAIIMGAELNRRTGKQIPLKGLFQFSRMDDFSRHVDGIACRSVPSENMAICHDAANAHEPFDLTDVQRAYLIGRDPTFELGGVSTHNYREDRFTRLDVALLTWCVNQLVYRHSALRTVYSLQGNQRVLREPPPVHVAVQDMCRESPQGQRAALLVWREELEQQVFDASAFPLFELRVTQCREHCVLHLSWDVLIMDAQSVRIFMNELDALYRHPKQALPPLGITFRDYQLEYQKLKASTRYQRDRQYWHLRLPELPSGPALATACRPDRVRAPRFARQGFSLDAQVLHDLQARTRQEKISTTVPFLALYGEVLARWSANEHFLINLTLFQREDMHPDTQRLVGDFTVLSLFEYRRQQETTRQSMYGVQSRLWDDLFHTLFTGLEVQSALAQQNQSRSDKPIAPVVLTSLLGLPHSEKGFLSDGHQGRDYARTQTSQVWLDNNIYERDGGVTVEWDYVSQLFGEEQIRDMLDAYRQAIVTFANGDWDKPLHIPLPPAHEQFLRQYNDTACPECMPTRTLHQQFLESAGRSPDALAVVSPQCHVSYSYRQTEERAAQLAHRLQVHAVVRHERVMICAEKGPLLVCGMLGIMITGAVFVPVNVQWPVARLRSIISQAQIRHVVLTRPQLERLGQQCMEDIDIVYHLVDDDNLGAYDIVPPAVSLAIDDPAYVIFTSGSTGKPKGVCISHRGVVNTLHDMNQRLALTSDDRTLCLSNISFDLAIYDVFGPLLLGGAVVMPGEDVLHQPDALLGIIDDYTVSVYNSVPAIMSLLLQSQSAGSARRLERVRHVLLSGDFIPLDLPGRIKTTFTNADILSLGGATEGSIWSIGYPLCQDDPVKSHWTSIPYGKPLRNQQVWILDANRQPCPLGVPGEIYLAGCGVALGYENDDEKTTAHFGRLADGQRYYRTGDGGVMHWAGHVEILGRLDRQVKINGFRVELGEIDSVLQAHPAVQTTFTRAITLTAHDHGKKSVAAYVVSLVSDRVPLKLEKRGIRRSASTLATTDLQPLTPSRILADVTQRTLTRKSYRHYETDDQLTLQRLQPLILAVQPVKRSLCLTPERLWTELAVLLTPLRAFEHQIEGLNKHLYPSAGGTYPVRTYITLSRAWGEYQGYYYHHPENHALVQLACDTDLLPETGVYLQLNAYLPAIEPEYHQHALAYSRFEAGCMLALLDEHGGQSFAPLPSLPCSSENEVLLSRYRLEEQAQVDGTSQVPLPLPEHSLLLLKTAADWQAYCLGERRLFQRCGDIPLSFNFGQGEYNDAIISQASALLLLPDMPALEQGRLVQCLSEHLLKASLGSCLLGQLELEHQLPTYQARRTFQGALAIGKVTADAMTSGEADNTAQRGTVPLADELRAHLLQQLPDYIVPDDIICLPRLPLTANGKVDVSALPLPTATLSTGDACPPRDQYEECLQVLWTEVLDSAPANNAHADFFLQGGNSLNAILLAMKISQRFARMMPTAFVYKHRTMAQQARAIVECVLQPTQDRITLNVAKNKNRLVLFSPSDSGAEAYYALAQALAEDVDVTGINHFFLNYPDKVTVDWSVALDFYCRQVQDLVQEAPEQPVWLGGWSMGGNIAVAVAERLAGSCPQIRPQLIVLDSLPGYDQGVRQRREVTEDVWSPYHPNNIMYRQFAMAGYSRRRYYHYVDCLLGHLDTMQVTYCHYPVLLIKCLEPMGHFYSDMPDNHWGKIADGVVVHGVAANHYSLLIDKAAIHQVADIVRCALDQAGKHDY